LIRYQFGNHLGSASLELDDQAQIISYEEHAPYGSSTYQAVRSQTETPKRYRHAGKERDEESGLYYYGGRYYSPWLGRWTSTDPLGIEGGPCLYAFVYANPIKLTDPNGSRPRLTTWLMTGEWEASEEQIRFATSDMRRTDTNFNTAALTGALVGIVGVFENTALMGYDIGRVAFWNDEKDNMFADTVRAVQQHGPGVLVKGIAHQATKAFEGDAVAFGELAFSLYVVADSAAQVKVTPTDFNIPMPPALAPELATASVTVAVPVMQGAGEVLLSGGVMMVCGQDPPGGEDKPATDDKTDQPAKEDTKPAPVDKASIKPGMELDPAKSQVFRGGKDLTLKPGEIKLDPKTGLVKPSHGPSLDVNASTVERFGGAQQIKSIPAELKIIQRGARPEHFEIVPREPMPLDKFQELLNQVQFY
jgi:RHS repeat-associated protein